MFLFFMMLARTINEEDAEGRSENSERAKKFPVQDESIKNIVNLVNKFYLHNVPKYKMEYGLESVSLFKNANCAKLIELFCNWLTMRKYISNKIRVDEQYPFGQDP